MVLHENLPSQSEVRRKFLAGRMSPAEVLGFVRRHPAMFREPYPPRGVNNIYLDLPALGDYHDHVQGVANRAKMRIRWYGPCGVTLDEPVLEHKIKRGIVGGKVSHPLPTLHLKADEPLGVIEAIRNCPEAPARLRVVGDGRIPSLVNRYQRRYFVSADGHFRLTVDWDLQFADFRRFASNETLFSADFAVIIELKYPPSYDDSAAAAVANMLPFRLTRCSKYVLGIEYLSCGRLT